MDKVVLTQFGGPENLVVQSAPIPAPAAGHVVVKIAAAGVNFLDIYQRSGAPAYGMTLPYTPGLEGAGVVHEVGEGVTQFSPGDRVAWTAALGSYAQYASFEQNKLVLIPEGLDLKTVAAAMLQTLTAHYLINSSFVIKPGDVALVHAAAGGTGSVLSQMILAKGGTVIATTSSQEKVELISKLGVKHIIRYDEVDFAQEVRKITDGRGVDVVYDGVGLKTFDKSLESIKTRGMMVLFGAASGAVPPFELQRLNSSGSLTITRPTLMHFVAEREEYVARSQDIFSLLLANKLSIRIDSSYPLEGARQAHERLASGKSAGKLILEPVF
jgi:NADPH2:quinone reductase